MEGQQEARVAAVNALRVHANQVMLGTRSHIEVSHIDALRIADLVRELTEDRDGLRRTNAQLWERMDILEAHIERLGSSVDVAFAEAASGIETEGQDAQRLGAEHESPTAEGGDAPTCPISPSITRR